MLDSIAPLERGTLQLQFDKRTGAVLRNSEVLMFPSGRNVSSTGPIGA